MSTVEPDDIELQWYQALFEEDCLRVMTLLEENPSRELWKQGWHGKRLQITGCRLNYWEPRTEKEWYGRTALHVGARRGCVELVRKVLELCGLKDTAGSVSDKNSGPSEGNDQGVGTSQDSWSNNAESQKSAGTLLTEENLAPPVDVLEHDQHEEPVPLRPAASEKSVALLKKGRTGRDMANMETQRIKGAADSVPEGVDSSLPESASISACLKDLLLSKDGEYGVDALAMAVLNGNLDVLSALLEAGLSSAFVKCHRTGIWKSRWKDKKAREDNRKEREDQRSLLADITEQVIESFSNKPVFQTAILEGYDKHRDFNFLDPHVYLFHFLFTESRRSDDCSIREDVLDAIWDKVWGSSPSLLDFLMGLQDGQGRPPLHVAVDEGHDALSLFYRMCKNHSKPEKGAEQAIIRAITAPDGGGRTAFHRSIILDDDTLSTLKLFQLSNLVNEEWRKNSNIFAVHQQSLWEALSWRSDIRFDLHDLSKQNGFKGMRDDDVDEYSTPLHSAVIHNRQTQLQLYKNKEININSINGVRSLYGIELPPLPFHTPGGGGRMDTVQLAALVSNVSAVKLILELVPDFKYNQENPAKGQREDIVPPVHFALKLLQLVQNFKCNQENPAEGKTEKLVQPVSFNLMQLVQKFTKYKNEKPAKGERKNLIPPLHFAAASGRYEVLKLFVDDKKFVQFEEDFEKNTALHYATCTEGANKIEFNTHLVDYVNCEHILKSHQERRKEEDERDERRSLIHKKEDFLVDRQGCIDLLLQAGCDVFKINKKGKAPYPGLDTGATFIKWWHEKQAKEFGTVRSTLGNAANAISVTAALVATASYVGPLQPPLGYGGDDGSSQLQLDIIWVKIFIVCDTMSFYLAIAAVIFALIPSLPMPQQSMSSESRNTQKLVTTAVVNLFPSIILVLVAFASGSVAVIETDRRKWNRGGLTIGTACVGGFICLLAILSFFIRLLVLIHPRSKRIRNVYDRIWF